MRAEIISVGTELLLGQIHDTNSSFIASKLAMLGVNVYYKTVAGDNMKRLKAALKIASTRANLIIISGGLGPTVDDITKETLAEFLGYDLVLDQKILLDIKNKFKRFNVKMPEGNIKQALVFKKNAVVIKNKIGTAPGFIVNKGKKIFIILPGVPEEMIQMFNSSVLKFLKTKVPRKIIFSRILKVIGLPESQVNKMIKAQFESYRNPTIALLAKPSEISIRLTARGKNLKEVKKIISKVQLEMEKIFKHNIFGYDEDTLESVVGGLLLKKNLTISLAESCTGGMLGNRITNVSGSSKYFLGATVCYACEVKEKLLKIKKANLLKFGAVSSQTALAMAKGVRKLLNADIGISITGVAGPTGGTKEKPVGLVFMAIDTKKITKSFKFMFYGTRKMIKVQASQHALNILRLYLLNLL
ncbi:competence/damage-inducible protein A [Candidatus Dependentiae bacterium]|nr:competence/damage-inducible protein A [Candidatus Dependentiae bacterium]